MNKNDKKNTKNIGVNGNNGNVMVIHVGPRRVKYVHVVREL